MSIKDYIAKGDCLELMETIPDKSIDLVLCDLPYGLTDAHWDTEIPFDDLWSSYKRIVKINGTVILFGIQPFTTKIISSNIKDFQCVWYWKKGTATGHLSAKKMPLRCIEDIVVFRVNRPYSNNKGLHIGLREYFLAEREKCGLKRKEIAKLLGNQMVSHYFTMGEQFAIPTKADYIKLQSTGYFQRDYQDVLDEFRGNRSKAIGHPTYNPQGVKKAGDSKTENRASEQSRRLILKHHTEDTYSGVYQLSEELLGIRQGLQKHHSSDAKAGRTAGVPDTDLFKRRRSYPR